jgi:hypothetical protein
MQYDQHVWDWAEYHSGQDRDEDPSGQRREPMSASPQDDEEPF